LSILWREDIFSIPQRRWLDSSTKVKVNKSKIGQYLGEHHLFNQQVMKHFVSLHDFTGLILVQALRQFLWSFTLPGEAQKIDRIMESFAIRYCECNNGIFINTDTCYIVSFAVIMLNTTLHNPCVKHKTTLDEFVKMNRGIDNGADLPTNLLQSLYESIKQEPFKIPCDDGNDLINTFFDPLKEDGCGNKEVGTRLGSDVGLFSMTIVSIISNILHQKLHRASYR